MTVHAGPARPDPAAPPKGFSVTVPGNWFEIDVHPNTRNAAINTLVTQRIRQVPELREHRAALVRALRAAARNAHAGGAAFCGAMVEGFDAAMLTASVTVSIVRLPDPTAGAHAIRDQLTSIPRRSEDSPWRVVEHVELAGIGQVPRTRGVEDLVAPEGAGWIRSVVMQTFVPFPGPAPDRIALVVGTSPILALEHELFDLFDAITGTFQFRSTTR